MNIKDGLVTGCRIIEVDAENRNCTVQSFGNNESSAGRYVGVQWLSAYLSPEGDEVSYVPRVGSLGLMTFFGGQPYIIGYFNAVTIDSNAKVADLEREGVGSKKGWSAGHRREKLNPGDLILRTIGKCRLVLRAGGEIELESTKLCKRTMFPNKNRVTEVSQNYEFATDGGYWNWTHVDQGTDSDELLSIQMWRDTVDGDNIVLEEIGSVNEDGLIHRYQIKPGEKSEETVLVRESYNTGKTIFTIQSDRYIENIEPTGEYLRAIGGYNSYLSIWPDGETWYNVNDKFDFNVTPDGGFTLDVGGPGKGEDEPPEGFDGKFQLEVKASGATSLDVGGKCKIDIAVSGKTVIDVGGSSTITIEPSGKVMIKASSEITCDAPKINLMGSKVNIGKSVSDVVPLGKMLLKMINKFIASFNSHTHMVPQAPVGVLPSNPPMSPAQSIGNDVLSQTVKVQE